MIYEFFVHGLLANQAQMTASGPAYVPIVLPHTLIGKLSVLPSYNGLESAMYFCRRRSERPEYANA